MNDSFIIKQNILRIEPFFSVLVSGLNATDKTPIYEMRLITCFGFKVGASIFLFGFWAMAFCHWRFVLRSLSSHSDALSEVGRSAPWFS